MIINSFIYPLSNPTYLYYQIYMFLYPSDKNLHLLLAKYNFHRCRTLYMYNNFQKHIHRFYSCNPYIVQLRRDLYFSFHKAQPRNHFFNCRIAVSRSHFNCRIYSSFSFSSSSTLFIFVSYQFIYKFFGRVLIT